MPCNTNPITLLDALRIAARHSDANNSAALAFCEAKAAINREDFTAAGMWLRTCVKHAVGVFHPDFKALA
jgi:hypothetical protein